MYQIGYGLRAEVSLPQHTVHDVIWPTDSAEFSRWQETRLRRRLLEGAWGEDLERRLVLQHGEKIRAVKGPRTMAKNAFQRVPEELAVLYFETPDQGHMEAERAEPLLGPDGMVATAGLWPMMRRVQTYTLGLRQDLVRVGWSYRREGLYFRHVTPDLVTAEAPLDDPGVPWKLRELRFYPQLQAWCWEVFDVSDMGAPSYSIHRFDHRGDHDLGEDVTAKLVDEVTDYPWIGEDGLPFIPYTLYHAEQPTALWDAFRWRELVDGALDLAVGATNFQHVLFRGSHSLKYGVDVNPRSVVSRGTGRASHNVVEADDPTGMVFFDSEQSKNNVQVGEFGPPVDPVKYMKALESYERLVTNVAGIDGSHIMRESSDAWSGAALTISREGKREAQRVYGPQFQRGDQELLAKAAKVANLAGGFDLPEDGYRVQYRSLPLTGKELQDLRDHHNQMIAEGRMSSVDAFLAEHPGITRTEAKRALARIAVEEALFRAMRTPDPQQPGNGRSDDDEERAA